jgi:hypothetical protein
VPPEKEIILTVKTLIVTDFMGWSQQTPEEEAESIAKQFKDDHGIILDYTHSIFVHHADEVNPKLIIMDYGGLLPGSDTDVIQLRSLSNWLEDHPSRLAILWTAFTSRAYRWELEDEFEGLDNLMHWIPVDSSGMSQWSIFSDELDQHQNKIIERLIMYFGENGDSDGQN